nr:MAG TPA: cell division protein [Caudoviricetes sp.]
MTNIDSHNPYWNIKSKIMNRILILLLCLGIYSCTGKELLEENEDLRGQISIYKNEIDDLNIKIDNLKIKESSLEEEIEELEDKIKTILYYTYQAQSSINSAQSNFFFENYSLAKSRLNDADSYIQQIINTSY